MSKIKDIKAREILDSRGNPTVEVDVYLESGVMEELLYQVVLLLECVRLWNFVIRMKDI